MISHMLSISLVRFCYILIHSMGYTVLMKVGKSLGVVYFALPLTHTDTIILTCTCNVYLTHSTLVGSGQSSEHQVCVV